MGPFKDIGVDLENMVATIEIRRPPHNFFDIELIRQIADACEALDKDPACRALVADLRTIRAGAFTLDRREPPADLSRRIRAAVAEASSGIDVGRGAD